MISSHSDEDAPLEVVSPRRNGWSCSWHPYQIVVWVAMFVMALGYFGFLVQYIPGLYKILFYLLAAGLLGVQVVAMVAATTINPVEPNFRKKLADLGNTNIVTRPKFSRSKHVHVIENHYCNLCQVTVSPTAKHCRVCDKCVVEFDHHCKWLNNCVGAANYWWFFTSVWCGIVSLLSLFLLSLALFVLFFARRDFIRFNCNSSHNVTSCPSEVRLLGGVVPDPVFPILCAVIAVVALVCGVFLSHLGIFHIYLRVKGLTTYGYLVGETGSRETQKKTEEGAKGENDGGHQHRHDTGNFWCFCCQGTASKLQSNRVVPSGAPISATLPLEGTEKGAGFEEETAMATCDKDLLDGTSEGSSVKSFSGSLGMVNFGRTPQMTPEPGLHGVPEGSRSLTEGSRSSTRGSRSGTEGRADSWGMTMDEVGDVAMGGAKRDNREMISEERFGTTLLVEVEVEPVMEGEESAKGVESGKVEESGASEISDVMKKPEEREGHYVRDLMFHTVNSVEDVCITKEETDVAKEKMNVSKEKTGIVKEATGVTKDKTSVAMEETSVAKEDTSVTKEEASIAKEETGFAKEVTGVAEEVTGVAEEVTGVAEEVTGVAEEETGVAEEETGVAKEETSVTKEETGISKEEAGVAEEVTGVAEEVTGVAEEKTGAAKEVTGVAKEVMGVAKENTGAAKEETIVAKEESCTTKEWTDVAKDRTKVAKEQTGIAKAKTEEAAVTNDVSVLGVDCSLDTCPDDDEDPVAIKEELLTRFSDESLSGSAGLTESPDPPLPPIQCPIPFPLAEPHPPAAVDYHDDGSVSSGRDPESVEISPDTNSRTVGLNQTAPPQPFPLNDHSPRTSEYITPQPSAAEGVLGRVPLPPISQEPLPPGGSLESSSQSLSRRTILQQVDQHASMEDQSRAGTIAKGRPLPPIGSTQMMEPMSPPGRRLPPLPLPSLGSAQDVVSLYSASSIAYLSSQPGSTVSLPILPDPRYSRNATPSNLKPHPPVEVGMVGGVQRSRADRRKQKHERKARKQSSAISQDIADTATTSQDIAGLARKKTATSRNVAGDWGQPASVGDQTTL